MQRHAAGVYYTMVPAARLSSIRRAEQACDQENDIAGVSPAAIMAQFEPIKRHPLMVSLAAPYTSILPMIYCFIKSL